MADTRNLRTVSATNYQLLSSDLYSGAPTTFAEHTGNSASVRRYRLVAKSFFDTQASDTLGHRLPARKGLTVSLVLSLLGEPGVMSSHFRMDVLQIVSHRDSASKVPDVTPNHNLSS